MRTLIQRVSRAGAAESSAPNRPIAEIGPGLVVLVGFEGEDSPVNIEQMVRKIRDLRIFSDSAGKMNESSASVDAQFLLISQFTLYADVKYGNRPSFSNAAEKTRAKESYRNFTQTFQRMVGEDKVQFTPFGSDLQVSLTNDGPVTVWLDSSEIL